MLVVEDDDGIRKLLAMALRRQALHVDVAGNGAEALRLCAATEYSLIILDLMMPVLNGFEFLEAFGKTTPSVRPIIFVVSAFDDRGVSRLTSPLVHAILRKPFDVWQLVITVCDVASAWADAAQPGAEPSGVAAAEHRPPVASVC
ncbi:MAG TPA: response regulator [Thermoanaerobaculia bacterium]|nr:response regulator [Thermoanaerobaculia bacterium]